MADVNKREKKKDSSTGWNLSNPGKSIQTRWTAVEHTQITDNYTNTPNSALTLTMLRQSTSGVGEEFIIFRSGPNPHTSFDDVTTTDRRENATN